MSKDVQKKLSIADLLKLNQEQFEIAPGHKVPLHPLSLDQIIQLLVSNQEAFIAIYSKAVDEKAKTISYGPILTAAPQFVAHVIALSMDSLEDEDDIRKMMPAQLQLIAIEKIFKISVPDPKKLGELLLEVTALLQKGDDLPVQKTAQLPSNSPTT